ncbi:Maleylpyruvate isomerase [Enhygromyxa salina]|uniref:Maleylpyruvate isomerase n=1 Tax=Enhygromyxa salina TaxID=215803 RepID=A0A2S9XAY1_9BACT|nr:glutathione S-transferase family protein [Enhygromyxa salina]PRP90016.1 Maleylpyruvate isomerase [Enhygromyxa salina]
MSKPVITGFPQSNYVWTVRAALGHKGVDHEFKPIGPADSKTAEHLARHPWGKVPVLEHDGFEVYETTAICTYVDEAFEGPALRPSDAKGRARVQQVVSITNSYLYPAAVVDYALQYVFPRGPEGQPDRAVIEAAVPQVKQALEVLERLIGERKWLVGDTPTLADYFVGPLVAVCGMFPESKGLLAECPQLGRLLGQLMQVPAFTKGAPPAP